MKKVQYIKCPRCELNYMKSTDKICDVCQAELSGKLSFEDDEDKVLCPECNMNYINIDERMCEECLRKQNGDVEGDVVAEIEKDEEWRSFLDDDKDIAVSSEEMEISLSELEESEKSEDYEEEYSDDLVDVLDNLDT